MSKPTLAEQIRCVEREIAMRGRVYPGLVDRRKMTEETAVRETAAMGAALETLKACEQLAQCLDDAPRHGPNVETITMTDELARKLSAQLRGVPWPDEAQLLRLGRFKAKDTGAMCPVINDGLRCQLIRGHDHTHVSYWPQHGRYLEWNH